MKYTTLLITLLSLTPTLTLSAPQSANSKAPASPQCKLIFNDRKCKDLNKSPQFEFTISSSSAGKLYPPHAETPASVGAVSHCYDFLDKSSKDKTKDIKAKPEYDVNGRTVAKTDKRPLFNFQPGTAHMWMTEDKCSVDFKAVAVFERNHCQGAFTWYNLPVIKDSTKGKEKSVVWDKKGEDWCVAPFKPMFGKRLGSFMMLKKAPEDKYFGLQVDVSY